MIPVQKDFFMENLNNKPSKELKFVELWGNKMLLADGIPTIEKVKGWRIDMKISHEKIFRIKKL